jgi:hypothetical protein
LVKYLPFHILILWNGSSLWRSMKHVWQKTMSPMQSEHRKWQMLVPHWLHKPSWGWPSISRRSCKKDSRFGTHSLRKSFWLCVVIFQCRDQTVFISNIPWTLWI